MFLERKYHFRYHKTCLQKEESTSLCCVLGRWHSWYVPTSIDVTRNWIISAHLQVFWGFHPQWIDPAGCPKLPQVMVFVPREFAWLWFTLMAAFLGNHNSWEQGWGNELLSYCLLSFCFFPLLLWRWIQLTVHIGQIITAVWSSAELSWFLTEASLKWCGDI